MMPDVVAERFELLDEAGAGGMGTVYRARDRRSGAQVAIKILHGTEAEDAERFEREAEVLARLVHPGIVGHVAHGRTPGGAPWLAMEWIDGERLSDRLAAPGGLGIRESLALVRQVAETVGFAHALGVVHRDLKPSNLMLERGDPARVRVLDFGIARFGASSRLTRTGVLIGTPGYLAPEQARGERGVDARADVFSLGCILFACLAGREVYLGESAVAVLAKILFEEVPRLSEIRPDTPPALDALVGAMLAKEPDGRPANGGAVVAAIDALEVGGAGAGADRLGATAASSGPSPAAPSITTREQRLVSVVVAVTSRESLGEGEDRTWTAARTVPSGVALAELRAAVSPYDARLERLAGGAVVAMLAGGGTPGEQAARAAESALALRARLPGTPMGLVTGLALVGERLPVGQVIDRAVRALRHAPGDAIAIDAVTAGLIEAAYELRAEPGAAEGLALVGRREVIDERRKLLGRETVCVGRDRELALVEAILQECAAESAPRVVLVTAAAGMGKSRLRYEVLNRLGARDEVWADARAAAPPDEALDPPSRAADAPGARAPGWGVILARGDPLSEGSAFGTLARAMRRIAGIFEGEAAGVQREKLHALVSRHVPSRERDRVGDFLGELLGVRALTDGVQLRAARRDPILMGDQLRIAWEDWLRAECAARPVLLVLEDLHWGDAATVQLVDAALRGLHDLPLMVLALARPEVHERFPGLWSERHVTEVGLGRLPRRAAEQLVHDVLGERATPERVARIVEQAEGNAFFLEELIRAVAEGERAAPEGERAAPEGEGVSLPLTILGMVQARLDGLDTEARRVLRAASVFGELFWQGGVAALVGGEQGAASLRQALADLCARELVARRAQGAFPGEAEYVFRHELVREAAYSMLTDRDRALAHRLAGDWLERKGAQDALVLAEHFERGGEGGRAARWYGLAAIAALGGNDLDGAVARARRGMQCAGEDAATRAGLLLTQAEALRWNGALAESVAAAEEAAAGFATSDEGGAEWHRAVAELATGAARLRDVARLLEWGRRVADASPTDPAAMPARVAALCALSRSLLIAGQPDLGGELFALAEAAARLLERNDPLVAARLYSLRAVLHAERSDLGKTLAALRGAAQSFAQAGDVRNAAVAQGNLASCELRLGQYAAAERTLSQALALARRMGQAYIAAFTEYLLGAVLLRLGRLAEARALEERAAAWFQARKDVMLAGASRIQLAEVLLQLEDYAGAEREARRGLEVGADVPSLRLDAVPRLARAQLALGRVDEAVATVREGARILAAMGAGGGGESEGLFRLALVEVLERAGDEAGSRAALADARRWLLGEAMKISDETLRRSFLENVRENARILELAGRPNGTPPGT